MCRQSEKEYKKNIQKIYKFEETSTIREELREYYSTQKFAISSLTHRYRELQFNRDNLVPFIVAIVTGLIVSAIVSAITQDYGSNALKITLIITLSIALIALLFLTSWGYRKIFTHGYTDIEAFVYPYEIKLIEEKLKQSGFDILPDYALPTPPSK